MPTLPTATPVATPFASTVAIAVLDDDQAIVGAAAPGSVVTAAVKVRCSPMPIVAPSGATVTARMPGGRGSGGGATVTSSPQAAPTSTTPVHRKRFSLFIYSPQ